MKTSAKSGTPKIPTKTDSLVFATLKCVCGKELEMAVPSERWEEGLRSVAAASKWKICDDYSQKGITTLDGYCPNCFYSEPRPGEPSGYIMHSP